MKRDVQQESSAVGCGVTAYASSDNSLCTYFVKRNYIKFKGTHTQKRHFNRGWVQCRGARVSGLQAVLRATSKETYTYEKRHTQKISKR